MFPLSIILPTDIVFPFNAIKIWSVLMVWSRLNQMSLLILSWYSAVLLTYNNSNFTSGKSLRIYVFLPMLFSVVWPLMGARSCCQVRWAGPLVNLRLSGFPTAGPHSKQCGWKRQRKRVEHHLPFHHPDELPITFWTHLLTVALGPHGTTFVSKTVSPE